MYKDFWLTHTSHKKPAPWIQEQNISFSLANQIKAISILMMTLISTSEPTGNQDAQRE